VNDAIQPSLESSPGHRERSGIDLR
jgi:hypothetical protein